MNAIFCCFIASKVVFIVYYNHLANTSKKE